MRSRSWPVAALALIALGVACESGGPADPTIAYQRLSLAEKAIDVGVNETEQLTLSATPLGGTVSWQSSNTGVATVSNGGLVSGRAIGTAKIVAAYGKSSDTATVTVHAAVTKLAVNPDSATVMVGQTLKLSFTAYDKTGKTITGLTGSSAKWSTSDPTVATVNADGAVQGVAAGAVYISLTVSGKTTTAFLRVSRVPVDTVVVSPSPSASVNVGSPLKFTATAQDSAGKPLSDWIVVWSSSDSSVATVSSTGAVSSYKVGSATITASAGGKQATATLITNPAIVASVVIAVNASTIQVGGTTQAAAMAYDSAGNQITGRAVTWASAKPTVATVSSAGIITGVDTGTANITATVDGVAGATTETVGGATIANLSVVLDKSTVPVGGTAQATAVATDASGNVLTGRTVTWNSSSTTIATVSSSGLVTAKGTGSVSISGTVDGKTASATLVVTTATVASITVTAPSTTIAVGQSTQATAVLKDASGNIVTAPVTWTSSAPAVASVSTSGYVTGLTTGSPTITATSGTASGTVPITVSSTTPSGPTSFVAPELPRSYVDSKYVPPTGSTINVPAGGDLQSAINNAKPGDEIVLQAGATYTGNYFLPVKSGGDATHWVTIRSSAMSQLPAEGTRVSPSNASSMARVVTADATAPAFATYPGSNYYRLMGLEVTIPTTATINYGIIRLGDAGTQQNTLSQVPHHLILDRLYVHGVGSVNVQRCIAFNSAWTAVVDSYVSDCHAQGFDAQAVGGWNGPGPFKIVNNHLEGSGENILFGGADPSILNLNPSDIEIRHNHIIKPLSWKGVWSVKNLLELKNAMRVWVEGNVLENNWVDAQIGVAILFQALSDNNTAAWTTVQDVTVRYNDVKNATGGAAIASRVAYGTNALMPSQPSQRISLQNNLFEQMGSDNLIALYGDLQNASVIHNTGFAGKTALMFDGNPQSGLVVTDNVFSHGSYGFFGSNYGEGNPALSHYAPGAIITNNVLYAGYDPTIYPSWNFFPASATDVGFTNYTGGDYSLSSSSPYHGKASDGSDPGANFTALKAAIAGVVQP